MKKRIISEEAQAELATELRKWRTRNNLLQREVAKMFGVSRWTIIRCEQDGNRVSPEMAYRVHAGIARELRKEGIRLQKIDAQIEAEPAPEPPKDLLKDQVKNNWMI